MKPQGAFPGGMTTAPNHPQIILGQRPKVMDRDKRKLALSAINRLEAAMKATDDKKLAIHLSEAYRLTRLLNK